MVGAVAVRAAVIRPGAEAAEEEEAATAREEPGEARREATKGAAAMARTGTGAKRGRARRTGQSAGVCSVQ